MLAKRIIPCLDVANGLVVKGQKFRNHEVIGEIVPLAKYYSNQGADELVLYDITASSEQRSVDFSWVDKIAREINIPFCVAGGIRDLNYARELLARGCDKISLNSPAQENPELISALSREFGRQAVVIGIDSQWVENDFYTFLYTGNEKTSIRSKRKTRDWINEIQERGAGEIVLNCMSSDGEKKGYDLEQIHALESEIRVPLVASGGAGELVHFYDLFHDSSATGALAASVFHKNILTISQVKLYLKERGISVRL